MAQHLSFDRFVALNHEDNNEGNVMIGDSDKAEKRFSAAVLDSQNF